MLNKMKQKWNEKGSIYNRRCVMANRNIRNSLEVILKYYYVYDYTKIVITL